MKLTIVIPVHNGGSVIGGCLDSLFASRAVGAPFEVVVVDDGSTDSTAAIVQQYPVRYLRIEKSGAAAARNAGIATATGDVVVLFDADVLLKEDTLRKMVEHLARDTDAFVVQGRWDNISPVPAFSPRFFLQKYHYNFIRLFQGRRRIAVANLETGCVAIRREVFEAAGVFDTRYRRAGGEEHELGLRILKRFPIYYYPDIFVVHRFGALLPTIRKIYFRTVNFSMLMFGTESRGTLRLHRPSVPLQDRISVLILLAVMPAAPVLLISRPWGLGMLVLLVALYLANISGFVLFAGRNYGALFAARCIFADAAIMVPRAAGLLAAVFHYFIRGKRDYRI